MKGWIVKETESMKQIALMAVLAMVGAGFSVRAQAPPQVSPATAEAQQAAQSQIPTAHAATTDPFPTVNPKNFTIGEPTPAVVNEFLKSLPCRCGIAAPHAG